MREIKTTIKNPKLVEKRRNQILKTTKELFRAKGYHATTMREICRQANVNQGSFYDYFQSKEDILVYIYKQVMNRNLDWPSADSKLSGWHEIEHFLKVLMSNAWNRDRHNIQLLYRETNSLDKKTKREVLQIESDFVQWVADKLREGLGLPRVDSKLEMIANLAVFANAFVALRGWNVGHLNRDEMLDFTVDMLMTQLKGLQPPAERPIE